MAPSEDEDEDTTIPPPPPAAAAAAVTADDEGGAVSPPPTIWSSSPRAAKATKAGAKKKGGGATAGGTSGGKSKKKQNSSGKNKKKKKKGGKKKASTSSYGIADGTEYEGDGVELRPTDVLFGRGSVFIQYEGNVRFRRIVCPYKPRYLMVAKSQKADIAWEIIGKVAKQKPPGRFLEANVRSDGDITYHPVPQKRAFLKTCQLLRERKFSCPGGCSRGCGVPSHFYSGIPAELLTDAVVDSGNKKKKAGGSSSSYAAYSQPAASAKGKGKKGGSKDAPHKGKRTAAKAQVGRRGKGAATSSTPSPPSSYSPPDYLGLSEEPDGVTSSSSSAAAVSKRNERPSFLVQEPTCAIAAYNEYKGLGEFKNRPVPGGFEAHIEASGINLNLGRINHSKLQIIRDMIAKVSSNADGGNGDGGGGDVIRGLYELEARRREEGSDFWDFYFEYTGRQGIHPYAYSRFKKRDGGSEAGSSPSASGRGRKISHVLLDEPLSDQTNSNGKNLLITRLYFGLNQWHAAGDSSALLGDVDDDDDDDLDDADDYDYPATTATKKRISASSEDGGAATPGRSSKNNAHVTPSSASSTRKRKNTSNDNDKNGSSPNNTPSSATSGKRRCTSSSSSPSSSRPVAVSAESQKLGGGNVSSEKTPTDGDGCHRQLANPDENETASNKTESMAPATTTEEEAAGVGTFTGSGKEAGIEQAVH